MGDWVKLIKDFQSSLRREQSAPTATAIDQGDASLTLLRHMFRMDATQKHTKITSNFVAAAMHLVFLKRSDKNLLVDLPDSPATLLQGWVSSIRQFPEAEH